MKKILFVLMLFVSMGVFAQEPLELVYITDGYYSISNVEVVENVASKDLYSRALLWVSETFKNPDAVMVSKDADAGIIVLNGIMSTSKNLRYEHRMTIKIKDGKYKWEINELYFPSNPKLYFEKRKIEVTPRFEKKDEKSKQVLLTDFADYLNSFNTKMKQGDNW